MFIAITAVKMYLAVTLVVLLALYTIFLYLSNNENRRKLSKIKSESALPFLGHVLKLGRTSEEFLPSLKRMWINLGRDKFLLKIGTTEHIVLTKPKDVEVILSSPLLIEKNILYKNFKALVGDSVLVCQGPKWRQLRKIHTPAFSFKVLESYVDIFNDEIGTLLKQLTAKNGQDIDVYPIFYNRALITVCRAGIGFDVVSNEGFEEYIESMNAIVCLTNEKVFSSWKSIEFIYNLTAEGKKFMRHLQYVHNKNRMVLESKKEVHKSLIEDVNAGRKTLESITSELSQKRLSFLDLLLLGRKTNGEPMTNEEIMDEVHTFTIAGHETTSSSASFLAYNLAMHPDVQSKAFQEQLSITEGDLNKPITYKDLQNMRYLDCVIKESMRLYPAVVFQGRMITEEVVLPDGTELPNGSNIMLLPYMTHRHPEVFSDAEIFKPERFLENPPSPYMFFPFSAGPRNCIGQKLATNQLKFWMASILRSLELLPPEGEHPKLVIELILKSSNGVHIRVRERSKSNGVSFDHSAA